MSAALFWPNLASRIFLAWPAVTLFWARMRSPSALRFLLFLSFLPFLLFFFLDFFDSIPSLLFLSVLPSSLLSLSLPSSVLLLFEVSWCAWRLARTSEKCLEDSELPPSDAIFAPMPRPSWRLMARKAWMELDRLPNDSPSFHPILASRLAPLLLFLHSRFLLSSLATIVMVSLQSLSAAAAAAAVAVAVVRIPAPVVITRTDAASRLVLLQSRSLPRIALDLVECVGCTLSTSSSFTCYCV
mmetsp:Transcript_298/g.816  ORF Transcript_298/g.816 Transcript_298/m.816 type:complete len:242 (-) Transcript_298:29-754(-)